MRQASHVDASNFRGYAPESPRAVREEGRRHPSRTGSPVPDALPEKLRGRAEKTLSGLADGGVADKDLRVLLDQAKRSFGEQAAAGRSRFEEQWRAVQESLEAMPAVRPPAPKRKR